MTMRAALPDLDTLNKESMKALILTQHRTLTTQEEEILLQRQQLVSKDELLASHQAEIERLKLLIAKLRRMQFGRRSEKLDRQIEQLELQLDELETAQAERKVLSPTPGAAPRADSSRPVRRPLPAHLPREVRKILPKEAACPDCGAELRSLSEDVSEILEYVPARFRVIRQVRPKLACSRCDKIVQAEAPSRPIARGMAGPGLLAMCWCQSIAIIFLYTGRKRFMRGKAWSWSARRWRTRSAARAGCWPRWSRRCGVT